jgi:signal transduction histidine kinase
VRQSLRARLFLAILGVVSLTVGASLALGIVLTRDAVRQTIRDDVERQADAIAAQETLLQAAEGGEGKGERRAPRPGRPGPPGLGGAAAPGSPPGPRPVAVLSLAEATALLPAEDATSLRRDGAAGGEAEIAGREVVFAARRSGRRAVIVTRPDLITGDDFRRYLSALLIAGGAAALLAAAVAALLARRLTRPLRQLATAAGELAEGRHPEPVPRGGTDELDHLAASFNRMADQLALARDAERAVLLSVSHDLRTPLTSIRGYAEGIEDGTIEPRDAAPVIEREAGRLERLVGDLLALARLRQGAMEVRSEPVDLAAVAREAEERLRPGAAEAGVEVEVAGAAGDAGATADHGRALQVVSNLVENAIRVSPEGGTVTIEAAPGRITVSDEGPGIPAEEIPRAFKRFHLRARAGRGSEDGAGLGLAIVRELSEAMGGSVAVENLPAQGARFTVTLPT